MVGRPDNTRALEGAGIYELYKGEYIRMTGSLENMGHLWLRWRNQAPF